MYYFTDNDKIVAIAEIPSNKNWQETDKNIVWSYSKCSYVFEEDLPSEQEEQQAMLLEEQAKQEQAEEEMLKPTVEDLAEALDILTNIVLGGE